MTSTVAYRQLIRGDVEALRHLMALFSDAFAEPETYRAKPPSDAYLDDLLANGLFVAVTASDVDTVIGGLTAYILQKPEQERSEMYIYDLAVAEAFRRLGIATGLIEALKPIARDHGCTVIFVQADPGDDPAIALYASLGEREDVHHFDIAVD